MMLSHDPAPFLQAIAVFSSPSTKRLLKNVQPPNSIRIACFHSLHLIPVALFLQLLISPSFGRHRGTAALAFSGTVHQVFQQAFPRLLTPHSARVDRGGVHQHPLVRITCITTQQQSAGGLAGGVLICACGDQSVARLRFMAVSFAVPGTPNHLRWLDTLAYHPPSGMPHSVPAHAISCSIRQRGEQGCACTSIQNSKPHLWHVKALALAGL